MGNTLTRMGNNVTLIRRNFSEMVGWTNDGYYLTMNDFSDLTKLDEGGFGSVWTGSMSTGTAAIKIFSQMDEYALREMEILSAFFYDHPNIIQHFSVIRNAKPDANGRRTITGYSMEYMELGSLHNEIHCLPKIYDIKLITTWICQIADGLDFLHRNNIIHRDIKPKNILLAARDHLKLADFGLAKFFSKNTSNTWGEVGTPVYIAPEVQFSKKYGPSADVYSLGVTIWEIVTRKHPWQHAIAATVFSLETSEENVYTKLSVESNELDQIGGYISQLVERCLCTNADDRPPIREFALYGYLYNTILIMGEYRIPGGGREMAMAVLSADRSTWTKTSTKVVYYMGWSREALYFNGDIYLFGGSYFAKAVYKVEKNRNYSRLADLNIGRNWIINSCLQWNRYIWIFGGQDKYKKSLKSVERYDPEAKKWELMPEMKYPRANASAVLFDDKIIITGGDEAGVANTVECFNPEDLSWTELPPIPSNIYGHTLVLYNKKLIAFGGVAGEDNKHSWELDPHEASPQWRPLPPMNHTSVGITGMVLDDEIYAIGGRNKGYDCLHRVEIFDGKQWREGPLFPYDWISMSAIIISQSTGDYLSLCPWKTGRAVM